MTGTTMRSPLALYSFLMDDGMGFEAKGWQTYAVGLVTW
ncbi:DUF2754 family protein [Shigella flexneri]